MILETFLFFFLPMWVGHACIWTWQLNVQYGRKITKWWLKPWRVVTGLVIVFGLPLILWSLPEPTAEHQIPRPEQAIPTVLYVITCLFIGAVVFPIITIRRYFRKQPGQVTESRSHAIDYRAIHGPAIVGRGKWWWLAKLPFTSVFTVDFTDLTLRLPGLPKAWDGLTILHLTDLHFHGTPAKAYFEGVLAETKARWPTPDVVVLTGDYVDTDAHIAWIEPLLSTLTANEAKLAIIGNHDEHHHPGQIREALTAAGYRVIGNHWIETTIRGERCAVAGHEGPWFGPPTGPCPWPELPKLCLTHTPDNVYWAAGQGVALAFAGHVHGGQVRIPLIGSIFVPSIYSRRFDGGVYEEGKTTMVVSRGVSGKEPLRFRCNPQVIRVTLRTS